jgi:imidazolonepropionase-like amidohydrolase
MSRTIRISVKHINAAHSAMTHSLTWVNARILGKERELGTIEPGKLADIVVVKGNPLFDIVALSNVDVVIKNGVPYRDSTPIDVSKREQ